MNMLSILVAGLEYSGLAAWSLLGLRNGYLEFTGKFNLPWSKFSTDEYHTLNKELVLSRDLKKVAKGEKSVAETVGLEGEEPGMISQRSGMLMVFGLPTLLVTVMYLACLEFFDKSLLSRFNHMLIFFFIFFHFAKRSMEVLFLHHYTSFMPKRAAYAMSGLFLLFVFNLSLSGFILPSSYTHGITTSILSVFARFLAPFLFFIGELGNTIHHYILYRLRDSTRSQTEGRREKVYFEPQEGFFRYAVCPHYFFESLVWLSFALIIQSASSFGIFFAVTAMLMGRSNMTRQWYMRNVENFHKEKYRMIPYVY